MLPCGRHAAALQLPYQIVVIPSSRAAFVAVALALDSSGGRGM